MLEKSAVVRGLEMKTTPGGTGDNKSSLCLDILAKRQSEVEFIYGKPLERAEEAGLLPSRVDQGEMIMVVCRRRPK